MDFHPRASTWQSSITIQRQSPSWSTSKMNRSCAVAVQPTGCGLFPPCQAPSHLSSTRRCPFTTSSHHMNIRTLHGRATCGRKTRTSTVIPSAKPNANSDSRRLPGELSGTVHGSLLFLSDFYLKKKKDSTDKVNSFVKLLLNTNMTNYHKI